MNWKWKRLGGHIHVWVYMNGSLNGKLCFTEEEFAALKGLNPHDIINFEEIKLTALDNDY